ncbi:hypothetical protein NHX12_004155, partial [Muraenolepis orangiensis]
HNYSRSSVYRLVVWRRGRLEEGEAGGGGGGWRRGRLEEEGEAGGGGGTLCTAVPDLDRESQDQFLVVLQAKDMGGHLGGLSGTTTVTVRLTDVNDNPPRFTHLVLISHLQPMSRSSSSSSISSTLTLYVPLVLRDGTSGLTSSSTVTVSAPA